MAGFIGFVYQSEAKGLYGPKPFKLTLKRLSQAGITFKILHYCIYPAQELLIVKGQIILVGGTGQVDFVTH